jgi:hypothetical protein
MVFNPEPENAQSSIRLNFESFSNVIDSNDLHSSKQSLQRTSTDAGIMIDFKPEYENTESSIRFNFESFSNPADSSDAHS